MWTILIEGQVLFQLLVYMLTSLEELDFNTDNIAKFQFPETPGLHGHIRRLLST